MKGFPHDGGIPKKELSQGLGYEGHTGIQVSTVALWCVIWSYGTLLQLVESCEALGGCRVCVVQVSGLRGLPVSRSVLLVIYLMTAKASELLSINNSSCSPKGS